MKRTNVIRTIAAFAAAACLAISLSARADDHEEEQPHLIWYQYAIYLLPGWEGDPVATATKLIEEKYDAYEVVDRFDEPPDRPQIVMTTLDDVPNRALSMSVKQIMKSAAIICSVPDERKAAAVQGSVEGPVTPDVPASILQQHQQTKLYLDPPAASLLKQS